MSPIGVVLLILLVLGIVACLCWFFMCKKRRQGGSAAGAGNYAKVYSGGDSLDMDNGLEGLEGLDAEEQDFQRSLEEGEIGNAPDSMFNFGDGGGQEDLEFDTAELEQVCPVWPATCLVRRPVWCLSVRPAGLLIELPAGFVIAFVPFDTCCIADYYYLIHTTGLCLGTPLSSSFFLLVVFNFVASLTLRPLGRSSNCWRITGRI